MYDTIKDGLGNLIKQLGFQESLESLSFEDASGSTLEDTFILTCEDGEADENNEQQAAFLYDNQKWTVQIAFGKSGSNKVEQKNKINRKKDELLAQLDDPANWRSFCTLLRYRSWSIEEQDNYFLLTIELKVKDVLTY